MYDHHDRQLTVLACRCVRCVMMSLHLIGDDEMNFFLEYTIDVAMQSFVVSVSNDLSLFGLTSGDKEGVGLFMCSVTESCPEWDHGTTCDKLRSALGDGCMHAATGICVFINPNLNVRITLLSLTKRMGFSSLYYIRL